MTGRYVIISPVRDEALHIGQLLSAVAAQTVRPERWIIVDDGSSDETTTIVESAQESHDFITLVRRTDRGHREAGAGVIAAFEEGYARISEDWDYLVKLDGDLYFGEDYFETCLAHFEDDPDLGIGGGVVYDLHDGDPVFDRQPGFHVRGATKIYRFECWRDIGGLVQAPGWDTLDEVKANHLGWKTRTFFDAPVYQMRPTGNAAGQWSNWVKNGIAAYRSGYHPAFVAARAGRRLVSPPSLVAPTAFLWGYLSSWLSRAERIVDDDLMVYLRREQWNRLLGRESIWR